MRFIDDAEERFQIADRPNDAPKPIAPGQAHEMAALWMQQLKPKPQFLNLSLLVAMSIDKVEEMQVIEGGTDAIISEHFNYKPLNAIRRDTATRKKRVVILMDE